MPRRLNQIYFAPGSDVRCLHCEHLFEKPYDRNPEMEPDPFTLVLRCPECGLLTVFKEQH